MITQETKANIIMLYRGQRVLIVSNFIEKQRVGYGAWNLGHPDFYLELKPLSEISDEDAKAMEYYDAECFLDSLKVKDISIKLSLFEADFLRSRGYALPYLNKSVDDLVKEGVFKLTDKN